MRSHTWFLDIEFNSSFVTSNYNEELSSFITCEKFIRSFLVQNQTHIQQDRQDSHKKASFLTLEDLFNSTCPLFCIGLVGIVIIGWTSSTRLVCSSFGCFLWSTSWLRFNATINILGKGTCTQMSSNLIVRVLLLPLISTPSRNIKLFDSTI